MSTQHTPGPTKLTFDNTHTPQPAQCGCELCGSTAVLLCPLHAAAPDLLAACEDLVGLAEAAMTEAHKDGAEYDIDGELSDARAAIAKAKGGE